MNKQKGSSWALILINRPNGLKISQDMKVMKQSTHYYEYNNSRYENMKELCDAIPTLKSKGMKHLLRYGIVKKIIN
tara:strand:- start:2046 stop:2273 length:228 start_codon:yes stop_codon:yes gene_type:complete